MDYSTINQNKIPKTVYLLLQKYHRLFGLGVSAWSKPPGNYYFSFFSHAVIDEHGRPLHFPEVFGKYRLTIYQTHLGLPAWGNDDHQEEHQDWRQRELRSKEMLTWVEERLTLRQFFHDYSNDIDRWRNIYTVEQSERYLLTWNVLGLFARAKKEMIHVADSDPNSGITAREIEAANSLGIQKPETDLHLCGSFSFGSNAKVYLPNNDVLDLWKEYSKIFDLNALISQLLRMR